MPETKELGTRVAMSPALLYKMEKYFHENKFAAEKIAAKLGTSRPTAFRWKGLYARSMRKKNYNSMCELLGITGHEKAGIARTRSEQIISRTHALIQEIRKAIGSGYATMSSLAELTGIPGYSLKNLYSGKRECFISELKTIAKVLEVDPESLVPLDPVAEANKDRDTALVVQLVAAMLPEGGGYSREEWKLIINDSVKILKDIKRRV